MPALLPLEVMSSSVAQHLETVHHPESRLASQGRVCRKGQGPRVCCCSVAKSCPTLCDPWAAARQASCPPLSPRACSSSCTLSQRRHPAISSFVIPFSSCPQSFPKSGSFQMNQLSASGGQRTAVSASTSVPPMSSYPIYTYKSTTLQ